MTGRPPAAGAESAGTLLHGRYRLSREIARGGMAAVWDAKDERLRRGVAVKILYPHLAADPSFLERFRREALAAARLVHPNIVQVFDSGLDDGRYFIVMELLAGGSLHQQMQRKNFPVPESCAVALGAARALHYAHGQGVIHRDIKPANILFTAEGLPKVGDFGIAKAIEHEEITSSHSVIGTAAYLSPEQVRGDEVRPSSDVYSLGVVLFELLTGERPFQRPGGAAATALARLSEPAPRVATRRAGIPAELDAIVAKALSADPRSRYAGAADFARDLEQFAGGRTEVPLAGPATAERAGPSMAPRAPATPSVSRPATSPAPPTAPQPLPPPPQAPGSPIPAPSRPARRRLRRLLRFLVFLVILATLAAAGVVAGKRVVGDAPISLPGAKSATVTAIDSFDPPPGDGGENGQRTGLARDGSSSTAWSTERYQSSAFGGLKSGVGLRFQFDARASFRSVTVHTTAGSWSAEVRTSNERSDSLDGYKVVGRIGDASADQVIQTSGPPGEYWLIWFTSLPPSSGGYKLEVTEVDFGGGA